MLSPMQFGGIGPVGSSRIGSLPNPRRNTSKEFFESFWRGNKAEIFFLFISTLFPLLVRSRPGRGKKAEIYFRFGSIHL